MSRKNTHHRSYLSTKSMLSERKGGFCCCCRRCCCRRRCCCCCCCHRCCCCYCCCCLLFVVCCCRRRCCCHCLLLETANSNNVSQGVQTLNGNKPVYRYESNSGGEREIQRTMLELLNQLDGFDSRGDVKVNIIVVDILHLLKACVQLCLIY